MIPLRKTIIGSAILLSGGLSFAQGFDPDPVGAIDHSFIVAGGIDPVLSAPNNLGSFDIQLNPSANLQAKPRRFGRF